MTRPETTPWDEPGIDQATVDRLMRARTMEEYLAIAAEAGVDWESLDDEWLEAIVNGDISELMWRLERARRRARKEQHAKRL